MDAYLRCVMEPGSAVGGVSATSLGEPATQMTLKTLMSITQGVPRIKEIINATPNMKTPIMTCKLALRDDADVARAVKARLDVTSLGSICSWIQQVVRPSKAYVECKLDARTCRGCIRGARCC